MRRLRGLGVGVVLLVGLLGAVPTASAAPPGSTTIGPVVDEIACDGTSITRTESGWYSYPPVMGHPSTYHLTWVYSNAQGEAWTYIDTGVIQLYERHGVLFISLSGHSVNVGPNGTGWIGHFVANQLTNEVWEVGLAVGGIDQLACSLLASS